MYKVVGLGQSRTFRVMWMLEELGQEYEHDPALPASDAARAHNPLGKIPALIDEDDVLTDSVAIMTYLADKHGKLTASAGSPARARQDAQTLWLVDEMDAILWANSKYTRIYPDHLRLPEATPIHHAEFERATQILSDSLADKPFIMGDALSLPDILAVHCLGWGHVARFPKPPENVVSYSKRLRDRAAYKAAASR